MPPRGELLRKPPRLPLLPPLPPYIGLLPYRPFISGGVAPMSQPTWLEGGDSPKMPLEGPPMLPALPRHAPPLQII
jgi:hypothetical protein